MNATINHGTVFWLILSIDLVGGGVISYLNGGGLVFGFLLSIDLGGL